MSTKLADMIRSYLERGCRIRGHVVLDADDTVVAVLPEGTIIERSMYEKPKQTKAERQEARDTQDQAEVDRKRQASGDPGC